MPLLGMRGIQRITLLDDAMILSGAGVGGGSLVYANTLYEPLDPFYRDPQWAHVTDWKTELAPHYAQARRMLGVNEVRSDTSADVVIRRVAERLGVADTFHRTPVGVLFGAPGERVPDPYFGGAGPDRTGCIHCGACMTGCRHGAKNTLDHNYLYLAERSGATVHPERQAVDIRPLPGGGYAVDTVRPGDGSATGRAPSPPSRWCSPRRSWARCACSSTPGRRDTSRTSPSGSDTWSGPTRRRSSVQAPGGSPPTTRKGSRSPPRSIPTR